MSPNTDPRLELVHRFFEGTGSSYDAMVHYATLGIDRRWKRRIVERLPPNPDRILDLACGTGLLTLAIARRFPQCLVTGVELRDEYLDIARRKQQTLGIRNVEWVLSRAEDYRSDVCFDAVVSSYLAKYADLPHLTASSQGMLKRGGLLLMHDFIFPTTAVLVRLWRVYFWVMRRTTARVVPAWRNIYDGLPRLIEQSRWREELTGVLRGAGFEDIRSDILTLSGSAIVSARKKAHATSAN